MIKVDEYNNDLFPDEILLKIFHDCDLKDMPQVSSVCKRWYTVAQEVIKIRLCRGEHLEKKAAAFLSMIPQSKGSLRELNDLVFKRLQEIGQEYQKLTLTQLWEKATQVDPGVYCKRTVCLTRFFTIDSTSLVCSDERRGSLAGKTFCSLVFPAQEESINRLCERTVSSDTLRKEYEKSVGVEEDFTGEIEDTSPGICFFPIELFHLTVGADETILGNKNNGTTCFILKGTLIEVFVYEGTKEEQNVSFDEGFEELKRDRAKLIHLKEGWAEYCYIPQFDMEEK